MRGAVMYAPGDVRVEDRPVPEIIQPTDAVIKLAATATSLARACRSSRREPAPSLVYT